MAGYTRQSTFTDGDIINAADSNDEFNQLVNVFSNTTGHKHDGTAAEGPVIGLIGDPGVATPINKVVVDDTNNRVGFYVDVSSISTEQIRVQDGAIVPVTDDDIDLGASGAEFKDLYIDGTANIDSLVVGASTAVTSVDTDLTSVSASDDTLASAKAIKSYVDAQVTAQDLDFQADSGGALNIDLDTETLTLTGGTGIDTSGAGNTVTFAIDSTVATLTGTQTLTNKTLTSAVLNTGVSGTAILDEDNMASNSATQLATQQSIKAYVDAQLATQDALDEVLTTGNSTGGTDIVVTAGDKITTDTIDETTAAAGVTIDGAVLKDSGAQLDSLQLNDTGSNYIAFNAPTTVTTSTTFTLPDGDGTSGQVIKTDGSGALSWTSITAATGNELENVVEDTTPQLGGNLDVNGNSIVSASNGDIAITPNGTGSVIIDGLSHPQADGSAGQFLKTDGAGQLAFATVTGATGNELENVVEDTTPQLGGDLDVNGNKITSASNGDIDIEPNGTGNVLLGNFEFDVDQTVGAGQDNYVLTYDNSTGHISLEAAAAGGISDVVSDTTPQLGGDLDTNGSNITFNDNDVAIFGAGSDLQIYHDASNSYISERGTGNLLIGSSGNIEMFKHLTSERMAKFIPDGAVELYYDNSKKLETVTGGVTVTGTLSATAVTGDGSGLTNLPASGDGGIAMAIALG